MIVRSSKYNSIEVFIHIIAWALAFGFPLVMMERESGFNLQRFIIMSILPIGYFTVFYANYLVLVPRLFFKEKNKSFIFWNIIIILGMTIVIQMLMNNSIPPPQGAMHPTAMPYFFFIRDLVMMIFVAALGAAIRISMRWRFLKEQLVESEKQKTDAELKNLKNQLNPHFLLNTLNNIYALVEFNQEKAQEAIQELSKLLRYMLYEDQTSLVPLAKEYDFIRNYVELMKIRLPEHVSVQMNLTEEPQSNVVIAPFIFISLIENAFKHGVSPSENSFINISIIGKYNGNVVCEILNSNFPKSSEDKSGHGIGLEQVQKRLDLIYPNHYEWTNDKDSKNVYHSILTIQTR